MAYITNYNFNRITKGFTMPKDKSFKFDDTIIWTSPDGTTYGQSNPSRLFAKWDINDLLLFKAFCKDTELAASRFYRVLPRPIDSYRYVEPERAPSYHNDPNCPRLHSEFERVLIPEEIREQGINKVIEFRDYWNEHEGLRLNNPKAFVARVNLKFKTRIRGFEVETKGNSGVSEIEDISIKLIDDGIDKKMKKLMSWAQEDERRREIFTQFAYLSYLGNSPEKHIMNNPTCFTEKEIKEVLRYVHPRKMEIIRDLHNLYIKTFNPDLSFDCNLLTKLGFVSCGMCRK